MEQPDPDRRTAELVQILTEQVGHLARQEARLAALETRRRGKRAVAGIASLGISAVFAMCAVGCLVVALAAGLAVVLGRPWFAALIVAALLFGTAGFVVLPGWKGITDGAPDVRRNAIARVRADLASFRTRSRR